MNKTLYGKTILIGREKEQQRLYVCVMVNGEAKSTPIGQPGSVPESVSRCQPTQGMAHCKIDIDGDGVMKLTNMKQLNVTYVDGSEVSCKRIEEDSYVTLGRDRYFLDLGAVLTTAETILKKVLPPPPAPACHISHLEQIESDYKRRDEEIDKKMVFVNMMTRIPFLFSLLGGSVAAIANQQGWKSSVQGLSLGITIASLIVFLYGLYLSIHNPAAKLKKDNLEQYKKDYVCPNCNLYLPYDYRTLSHGTIRKKCPHCGSQLEP